MKMIYPQTVAPVAWPKRKHSQ